MRSVLAFSSDDVFVSALPSFFLKKKSCVLSVSASLEVYKILRSDIDHH